MKHKLAAVGVLALLGVGVSNATAGAAPKPGLAVVLNCGGEIVDVSVAGNGDWTPAHDLNSNLVGVPIAFGEFTGTFTPTGGGDLLFTDPPFAKPNVPKTRNLIVDCTFTVAGPVPGGSVSGNGSVTLMVPRVHV